MTDGQYVIYHIPGKKVGCTGDFKQSSSMYRCNGYHGEIEILETVTGTAQEAGDVEWAYADKFGYPRSHHYVDALRRFSKANKTETSVPRSRQIPLNGEFLNAKQTAAYLGFSYGTIRAAFRLGQLPTVMVGDHKGTTKTLLEWWLAHCHEPTAIKSATLPNPLWPYDYEMQYGWSTRWPYDYDMSFEPSADLGRRCEVPSGA